MKTWFLLAILAACAESPPPACETLTDGACQAQDGCHAGHGSAFVCAAAAQSSGPACADLDAIGCSLRDDCESFARNLCDNQPPPCDALWRFDHCAAE